MSYGKVLTRSSAYISDSALKDYSHRLLGHLFSNDLSQKSRRLGSPRLFTVGEFHIPDTTTAVQRTFNKTRETVLLEYCESDGTQADFIPHMAYTVHRIRDHGGR